MAFWKRKKKPELIEDGQIQAPSGSKVKSPFLRPQGGEQDDRYMNLAVSNRNWQVAWRITAATLAMSIMFNGYYIITSKYITYIVAMDKMGQVVSVGAVTRTNPVDAKRAYREQMIDWVEYSRLIIGDQAGQKRFMNWVYARVQENSPAKAALDRFVRERKPFVTAAVRTIDAHVTNAIERSDSVYEVEWTETFHAPNGDIQGEERWKGIFTYRIVQLNTAEAIQANGVGFFITDFKWSKVLG